MDCGTFLADACPCLGPLVPLFWISGDVSSGFQSQSGFCLIYIASSWQSVLWGVKQVHIFPKDITGTSEAQTRNPKNMSSTR